MDLIRYVEELRGQLLSAAEAGGPEGRVAAERLLAPLESSVRLALLEALADAASEITRELAPGSVEVRLRGREPEFVVTPAPAERAPEPPAERDARALAPATDVDEGATARITLRLPEPLKQRIEQAAGGAGQSVNAWLVRAVTDALGPDQHDRHAARRGPATGGDRFTGWAR